MQNDYLKKILNARVYDVAQESELVYAPILSALTDNRVWLKREDNQTVFSFKIRGAYNKMAHLSEAQRRHGVIAASAGNHAQGVALSATRLSCKAVIVMPVTTPSVKINAVKARGGKWVKVVLHGESYQEAYQYARLLEKRTSAVFVHPFDDPDVIAGQGTIAVEILRQHQAPIKAIFVAVGGGGLIAGVAAYIKAIRPEIQVIGVQTVDSDTMKRSLAAKRRIELKEVGLFSDGTAVKKVGKETFRLCQQLVDDMITVDTDQICAAIKDVFEDTRSILEPAGALAIAGLKSYAAQKKWHDQNLIAIACGANMNFDRLRFVAERAEVGEAREALFAVTMPEERGSLLRFCQLLGDRSVTEFNYRIADHRAAHIFLGVAIQHASDNQVITKMFTRAGFPTVDLTHNELGKLHIRHLVGGRSVLAQDELLYRFEFPERPGALVRFLTAMSPNWNISLFHYRNHGADYGRVLLGLQVPRNEKKIFRQFLAALTYRYWDESRNPAYHLFLSAKSFS